MKRSINVGQFFQVLETNTKPFFFSLYISHSSALILIALCVYIMYRVYTCEGPCIGHRLYNNEWPKQQIALWGRGSFCFYIRCWSPKLARISFARSVCRFIFPPPLIYYFASGIWFGSLWRFDLCVSASLLYLMSSHLPTSTHKSILRNYTEGLLQPI